MANPKIVSIHSAPRSGSTWLQMLFNAHPNVQARYQPLFSYAFKNCITPDSTPEEFDQFTQSLLQSSDQFLNFQSRFHQDNNDIPTFPKEEPTHLVMKNVHHHNLIETFIRLNPQTKIIALIRHPCAVINSYINNESECPKGWRETDEWLTGSRKNIGPEYYFGYNKWKETLDIFFEIQQKYPDNIVLVRYDQLVKKPTDTVRLLFDFVGLSFHESVLDLIEQTTQSRSELTSAHSIYKAPSQVLDRWKLQLDPDIIQHILQDSAGTKYGWYT